MANDALQYCKVVEHYCAETASEDAYLRTYLPIVHLYVSEEN
jgi:hypothetical protein